MILHNNTKLNDVKKLAKIHGYLDTSINSLLQKIEGFVELLKLESSNKNIFENCNLKSAFEKGIYELKNELKKSNGTISIDYSKFDFTINAVNEYLNSIVYNLVENAIKYKSPARELEIKIDIKTLHNKIVITISDNGIGIEENYLDKIYTMFTRFSRNSTTNVSGIGLYLVKKQISKMNGDIIVTSEINIGTKFSLTLPYNKANGIRT